MHFVELNIILSSCFYFSDAFGLYGLGNGYRFFLKELNSTFGAFDSSPISSKWIRQPLDHFDQNETRAWHMRYFERLDYWKRKGPIYLFINGEGPASRVFLQTGILYELAKETKGAMYLAEHRYYGKSKPFKDLTTENLAYLSSRQALADFAKLLRAIKMSPKYNESKVVVVGGSYAGNLAAWMRLLYPNLVDAAIASSAPVLAKKDFYEYLENVSEDFEQHGTPGCFEKIKEIFNRYDELFKTSAGIEQLKEEEQICESTDMNKSENKQLFFLDKTSEFMYEAQYGSPESIKGFCEDLTNTSKVFSAKDDDSDLWNEKNNCFDYDFDDMIENMRQVDWIMAWTYQTCTEFGYFPTTNSDNQPFTNNVFVDLFYSLCTKTYGDDFDEKRIDEGIERANNMYGGLKPNVTQVVFVNGDLDPYHKLGVLEDVSYEAPAKIIPLSSHCRDLFSDRAKDPEELKEARKYIKYLIKRWIGAGEYKKP
ncbi:putative serine protease K12H4.7 [Trichoplusia ni]|uniref:Serine protease K12H4.7 n=1 Tax=Trichoplusia ni TaxID=7111 RepID=A0A7E5WGQ1_TRINI|nr:putative serine protease K12H4.7 [Trichoplusia ni]